LQVWINNIDLIFFTAVYIEDLLKAGNMSNSYIPMESKTSRYRWNIAKVDAKHQSSKEKFGDTKGVIIISHWTANEDTTITLHKWNKINIEYSKVDTKYPDELHNEYRRVKYIQLKVCKIWFILIQCEIIYLFSLLSIPELNGLLNLAE
jgi:hypothetical protein